MIVLYIFLGIIIFLVTLFMFPVTIDLKYGEKIDVVMKYLFVKINLTEEKKSKKPKKEKEKPKKEDGEKPPNKVKELIDNCGIKGLLEIVKQLLIILTKMTVGITKKIKVKHLDIYFVAGGEDAGKIALLYGNACAIIYPAVTEIVNLTNCKEYAVSVDFDYNSEKPVTKLELVASLRIIHVVNKAIIAVFKAIPHILKLRPKKEKKL